MHDLKTIYSGALARCAPEKSAAAIAGTSFPRNVVAIGKCAGPLLDGVMSRIQDVRAFAAIPAGYPWPRRDTHPPRRLLVMEGGHPRMNAETFAAGRALLEFVDDCDEVLFLISGGGSACVDSPRTPFTEADLTGVNDRLLASGLPIGKMNAVRRRLSAIKGGRLAARVPGRKVTLIHSDVATGAEHDVASGPTMPDRATLEEVVETLLSIGCERIAAILRESPDAPVRAIEHAEVRVLAGNATLVEAARELASVAGFRAIVMPQQIEGSVEAAAILLADRARQLKKGELLIAGGEPTVTLRGDGRGGRCSELAVRFAHLAGPRSDLSALFGSSDGVDGNSGAAGIAFPVIPKIDPAGMAAALERSDSFPLAARVGQVLTIPPTGNNLRDLFLIGRPG